MALTLASAVLHVMSIVKHNVSQASAAQSRDAPVVMPPFQVYFSRTRVCCR